VALNLIIETCKSGGHMSREVKEKKGEAKKEERTKKPPKCR
jgi:hypothetical protein